MVGVVGSGRAKEGEVWGGKSGGCSPIRLGEG